jgi:hypothetical protein
MSSNTDNKDSFAIGKEFEEYLQNTIFNKSNYVLIEKTHDISQNSERYVESSKKPDFKFRCKKTKQEFYVEAKYRSKFNSDDKVRILELDQFRRYQGYNTPESPVFIAIGVEGTPSKPRSVCLIPLEKFNYSELYKSVIKKYKIELNKTLDYKVLESLIEEEFPKQKDDIRTYSAPYNSLGLTKRSDSV